MEKNKRMTIIVSVLLILGSISLAYFVGKTLFGGKPAEASLKTANIENSTITVKGELEFDLEGILPGHKNVSAISVTAKGNNELIPYNLIWDGNNSLNTELNYTVYKVSEKVEVTASCGKLKKPVSGGIAYQEECLISNLSKLGEAIASGTIPTGEGKTELVGDEFITSTSTGSVMYYYVILEYPNKETSQNEDIGLGFDGVVTVEASDAEPDIEIMAAYIKNEDTGEYEEADKIPTEGKWQLNEQSMCSNEATPIWDNENHGVLVSNLTQSGTGCVLYFEELKPAEEMLTKLNIDVNSIQEIDKFTGLACEKGTNNAEHSSGDCSMADSGVYSATTSEGTTYYYRGTVDNNWVKFGNYWWRIIRVNENGTVRMIYSGEIGSQNQPTDTSVNGSNNGRWVLSGNSQTGTSAYNSSRDNNAYVGFRYGDLNPSGNNDTDKYNNAHKNEHDSTILTALKTWYTNAVIDKSLIDGETGFCNDREKSTVNHGNTKYNNLGYGTNLTWYAPFDRVTKNTSSEALASIGEEQKPTFECKNKERDLITEEIAGIPVGLITSDEVIYAGGFAGQSNYGYWLYTGNYYWTMSPFNYGGGTLVFCVHNNGALNNGGVNSAFGVRPVINLKASVNFTGKGTVDDPYVVGD